MIENEGNTRFRTGGNGASWRHATRDEHGVQLMMERFWPGVTSAAVSESVTRLKSTCLDLAGEGMPIRYLGATFVPADESLSCRFDGSEHAVRTAYELAGEIFDRLVEIHEMGVDPSPTKEDMS